MSLPREIKEELLSAYLDDALSGDERTRVEQILAGDEEARVLLERMRSIQASTKAAMQANQRLGDGFSDRVIAAAIARAEQEQLPDQHHVRLAAARSGELGTAVTGRSQRLYGSVAAGLALAASLLLAVTFWNSFPGQDGGKGVAHVDPIPEANAGSSVASTDKPRRGVGERPVEASPELAIAREQPVDAREESAATRPDQRPTPDALATTEPDRLPRAMESEAKADAEENAESLSPAPATDQPNNDPAAMLATRAVMMFEVEQTDVGRENNAVLEAMRKAGIQANVKQRVNDAVVGYLQEARLVGGGREAENAANGSAPVGVVYVEASGKQLDRFMLSLFADTEQIARIGWNMAMDAPVVEAATQIEQVLATEVRHAEDSATAWQLVAGEAQQSFVAPDSGREFFPLDRKDTAGWNAVGSASTGPDIRSRLLILIR